MSDGNTPVTAFDMTPEQRRLWYLARYEEFGAAHVISQAWRLTGPIDEAALDDALRVLVERHELLRAVCAPSDENPRMLIQPLPTHVLNVEHLGSARAVAERCAELADQPISLCEGPLFAAYLLRESASSAMLLMCLHHLIADGWSMDVLTQDLSALYSPGGLADPAALDPLPLTAAEVPAALRAATAAYHGSETEAVAYWREVLRGAPESLDLPYDHARPARPGHQGDRTQRVLPAAAADSLRAIAVECGGTLFTALYAVLAGFLGRLADTEDVVLGVPVADRPSSEFEGLVGFFVNTLPIRVDLSADPCLAELVGRARDSFFEGCSHRNLAFDGIVRAAAPPRVPGCTPLFQVVCVLQNTLEAELDLAGLDADPYRVDPRSVAFDLTVEFCEQADGRLGVLVEYSTELFTPAHGRLLAERLAAFATAWAADPSARLGAIPLLLPAEEELLLDQAAVDQAQIPGDVLTDVTARLQAEPDRVVLRSGGRELSAGQLLARAAELADELTAAGVQRGDRVGVFLPRGVDAVAALLAVLELDAVYVPLDGRLPAARLQLIESQSGLRAVLTAHGAFGRPDADPPSAPGRAAADADAFILFTSGSSGVPKGVLVGRRALTNLIRDAARRVGLRAGDVVVASGATSFDISLFEFLAPLAAGGVVEVADDRTAEDPTLLAELLGSAGATMAQATPSVWQLLLEDLAFRPRVALTFGEALSEELRDRLLAAADEVYNIYGPTETTVCSTVWRCAPGPVGVGTAIANTELYVLDSRLRPLPPGCRGELLIGGEGLARGYIGQDDLTAASFVEIDLGRGPRRLYRTGDIASWGSDGQLRLHGRRDSQIKLRGQRIELAEIEARIRECAGIARCAVVPYGLNGHSGLAAFLVAAPGVVLDPPAVRRDLEAVLPGYMVPAFVLPVAELPLLASGKTDTLSLLADLDKRLVRRRSEEQAAKFRERLSPVMQAVTLAMQAILQQPVIPGTSFFDQGGDSLGAARVLALLRKALDVPLHMSDFVAAPSVRGLARRLEAVPGAAAAAQAAVKAAAEQAQGAPTGLARGLLDSPPAVVTKADKG